MEVFGPALVLFAEPGRDLTGRCGFLLGIAGSGHNTRFLAAAAAAASTACCTAAADAAAPPCRLLTCSCLLVAACSYYDALDDLIQNYVLQPFEDGRQPSEQARAHDAACNHLHWLARLAWRSGAVWRGVCSTP